MEAVIYSQKDIRKWLKNLDNILDPPRGKRYSFDNIKGTKLYDGITGRRLTGIMLKSALKALPKPLRAAVLLRWVYVKSLPETLQTLGVTKDQYYYRCDKAVECITYHCNGQLEEFHSVAGRYAKSA